MKRFLRSGPVLTLAAWLAARYVVFACLTARWRVEGQPHLEDFAAGPPCIVAFWHETMPAMAMFWLSARRLGLARPAIVLASRHRDGRLIGAAVGHLGIAVATGSTSRGGAAGLRALLRALAGGAHIGLTPDGPRGPRRRAAPGLVQLAALAGAPILPCAAWIAPSRRLGSWDGMRIPRPFGRGALVCGPPIDVARDWAASLPAVEAALTAALFRAETLA